MSSPPGGAGIVIASMAGHRESPYAPEIEHALATTETARLLELPCTDHAREGCTRAVPRAEATAW
ncbi:hypothetical protein [Streptomyces sp. NPDC001388]|uniref:hypothetical protein n=1 Tax=Streptomyces sp. NPDC001388 TaxID=3364568 RepID=UPI00368861E2